MQPLKHKFWWFYFEFIPNCISVLKNETNQRYIPKHKIFHRTEQIINSDLVPWSWACKIVHKSRMPTYNIPSNRERRKYNFFLLIFARSVIIIKRDLFTTVGVHPINRDAYGQCSMFLYGKPGTHYYFLFSLDFLTLIFVPCCWFHRLIWK